MTFLAFSFVFMAAAGALGSITRVLCIYIMSEEETKDQLRKERVPLVVVSGKDQRRVAQIRDMQSIPGQHYTWGTRNFRRHNTMNMTKIGEVGVAIKDTKL